MLQALNDRLASFLDHSAIIHTIQPIDKEQRRAKSSGLKDLSEAIERLEIRSRYVMTQRVVRWQGEPRWHPRSGAGARTGTDNAAPIARHPSAGPRLEWMEHQLYLIGSAIS